VGLWNYIWLLAGDGAIPVFTTHSLCLFTSTIHTIAASPHESLLAIESLLWSLLESLLDSLLDSLLESRAWRGVEFSTGSFWPMANSEFVEALANRKL